ncbi:hypothetical protein [Nitrobacter sp.]|uniref:hypothetical protein n=1 Tax=Nitrobacter sp. TaxID=29420 RepID=UPI00399D7629
MTPEFYNEFLQLSFALLSRVSRALKVSSRRIHPDRKYAALMLDESFLGLLDAQGTTATVANIIAALVAFSRRLK